MKCSRCNEVRAMPAWERGQRAALDAEEAVQDQLEGLAYFAELAEAFTLTTRLHDLFAGWERRAHYTAADAAADAADMAHSDGGR